MSPCPFFKLLRIIHGNLDVVMAICIFNVVISRSLHISFTRIVGSHLNSKVTILYEVPLKLLILFLDFVGPFTY